MDKKVLRVEDPVSVEDAILEYLHKRSWKDYDRFVKVLAEEVMGKKPRTHIELKRVISSVRHPFFAFNGISNGEFVQGFPTDELLRRSIVPRVVRKSSSNRKSRRPIPSRLRFLVLERDGYRCQICGRTANGTTLEVDHKVPVAKGGTDSLKNLWTLCFDCNRGKSDLNVKVGEPATEAG